MTMRHAAAAALIAFPGVVLVDRPVGGQEAGRGQQFARHGTLCARRDRAYLMPLGAGDELVTLDIALGKEHVQRTVRCHVQ
jgi:hypothetical protein